MTLSEEEFAALVEFMREHDEVRQAFIALAEKATDIANWVIAMSDASNEPSE